MADFDSLEKQIEVLAQATAKGFENVQKEFEGVHGEIAEVKGRLDVVDQKLERIERTVDSQMQNHMALETRVTKLEQPVA